MSKTNTTKANKTKTNEMSARFKVSKGNVNRLQLDKVSELLDKAKKVLTKKELYIFTIMANGKSVPFIKGKPGIGKTAIMQSIADKLGFHLLDIRLSMMDSADMLIPSRKVVNDTHTFDLTPVELFLKANEKPTIIFFDEINRAKPDVQNASLQIINERKVGANFYFNDNVLISCAGNLGEEDGTNIEEVDSALNSRLIHLDYDLDIDEWIEGYAKDNVHPLVINFINANPTYFYHNPNLEDVAQEQGMASDTFACARTWSKLSDNFETATYDPETGTSGGVDEMIDFVSTYGKGTVGSAFSAFIKYLKNLKVISPKDILDGKFTEDVLKKADRSQLLDIALRLEEVIDITKDSNKVIGNINRFLEFLNKSNADQVTKFYQKVTNKFLANASETDKLVQEVRKFKADNNLTEIKEEDGYKNYNKYVFVKVGKNIIKKTGMGV